MSRTPGFFDECYRQIFHKSDILSDFQRKKVPKVTYKNADETDWTHK